MGLVHPNTKAPTRDNSSRWYEDLCDNGGSLDLATDENLFAGGLPEIIIRRPWRVNCCEEVHGVFPGCTSKDNASGTYGGRATRPRNPSTSIGRIERRT